VPKFLLLYGKYLDCEISAYKALLSEGVLVLEKTYAKVDHHCEI
jgi:hypothetical protein